MYLTTGPRQPEAEELYLSAGRAALTGIRSYRVPHDRAARGSP
jgi:hypothetical protein